MKQHTLKASPGLKAKRKRVGRGGKRGTYSGRGMNGQNARSGGGVRIGFEGGQTPFLMRMPKLKGFKNPNKVDIFPLNLSRINDHFEDGEDVSLTSLLQKGILKKPQTIKLLGQGELKKKVNITVDMASESAQKKVEKAGAKLTLIIADKPANA